MKIFGLLMLVACAASGTNRQTANSANSSRVPVLVELFTSEGCSSCPPADELLQRMDTAQPIPGALIIVLSEHVDYWNHDGWKDPYSSSISTDRQIAYVRALGLNTPYTPQMLVDGTSELRGTWEEHAQTIEKAAALHHVSIRIGSISVAAQTPAVLSAQIEAEASPEKHNAEVYVVVALDHAESQVLDGENSGKHLVHVAVVQEFKKIGKLEKAKSFSQDFQVKLKPGTDPSNIRVVAFVQESGPGRVLGTALQKVPK
ncbi:MAG TPA: DUF1223 domain-containing protein [Candidatus Angelobacter sp.]|jgi:hypothetical protein